MTIWEQYTERRDAARRLVLERQKQTLADPSRENCAALHAAIAELVKAPKFPPGVDVIQAGECPVGGVAPIACFFCPFGHMTECHYPQKCAEAQCGHFEAGEPDAGFAA